MSRRQNVSDPKYLAIKMFKIKNVSESKRFGVKMSQYESILKVKVPQNLNVSQSKFLRVKCLSI